MANKIGWCDITRNNVRGCNGPKGDGKLCSYCFAARMARRWDTSDDFKPMWQQGPYEAKFPRRPSIIFHNSMSDIADWDLGWIAQTMGKCRQYPQHIHLFLTKRPKIYTILEAPGIKAPPNVWAGLTITSQYEADCLIPVFMEATRPERKRFLSIEPLQGPIDLLKVYPRPSGDGYRKLLCDWVIIGGPNGPGSWPVQPRWVRSLIDQSDKLSALVYFKGWGEWYPITMVHCWRGKETTVRTHQRVGHKLAGRKINGREWLQRPVPGE